METLTMSHLLYLAAAAAVGFAVARFKAGGTILPPSKSPGLEEVRKLVRDEIVLLFGNGGLPLPARSTAPATDVSPSSPATPAVDVNALVASIMDGAKSQTDSVVDGFKHALTVQQQTPAPTKAL